MSVKSVKDQTYSYSRLSSFATCPYKWYQTYVLDYKEPARSYFSVGTICHEVAEFSANYCTEETFVNKAMLFYRKSKEFQECNRSEMDPEKYIRAIYHNRAMIKDTKFRNFGNLSYTIDDNTDTADYEIVSMPPMATYLDYFNKAVANEKVTDPEIIEESRYIAMGFFRWYDFSIFKHEIMLAEKKLAFTKDWNKIGFFSPQAYFRGVIDNTIYSGAKDIIITDYKTSRSMLTESQVAEDPQLRSYVKMMQHALGRDNLDTVTVRIVYMRFKKIVSYTFEDVDAAVESIGVWINTLIEDIEEKGDNLANYPCVRNQFCGRCHIREDGECPIFQRVKLTEESSTEMMNEETCKAKWKESEVLKDKYQAYQKECKEFINDTDGVVIIDENAVLDKHLKDTRKFSSRDVVTFALSKGKTIIDVLPFLTVTEPNAEKMMKRLRLKPTPEEMKKLYKPGVKSSFAALTREEMDK